MRREESDRTTLRRFLNSLPKPLGRNEERILLTILYDKSRRATEEERHEAQQKLVMHNSLGVAKVVFKYCHFKDPKFLDIFNDGITGLRTAIERFELSRNVRLITFAYPWIRKEVLLGLAREKRGVYVDLHLLYDRKKILQAARTLRKGQAEEKDVTDAQIAKRTGFSKNKVRRLRENFPLVLSLDHTRGEDDRHIGDEIPQETFPDPLEEAIRADNSRIVRNAIRKYLTKQERMVLYWRFFAPEPLTLDKIAEKLRVSRQWIHEVEMNAKRKLKKVFKENGKTP